MVASAETAGAVTTRIYLTGRDPAGLAAYAAEVSDPATAQYRKFLTSQEELRRFGPSPVDFESCAPGVLFELVLPTRDVVKHGL